MAENRINRPQRALNFKLTHYPIDLPKSAVPEGSSGGGRGGRGFRYMSYMDMDSPVSLRMRNRIAPFRCACVICCKTTTC